jgi:PAS domain S-box-containing protein
MSVTALRDARGAILGYLLIGTDNTARKQAEEAIRASEEQFRLLVAGVIDYAILMLGPRGEIVSWNAGAQRMKGYQTDEIMGQHFSRFYPPEDVQSGKPEHALKVAAAEGQFEDEGWRVRKDGTRFWANVVITAISDEMGTVRGFSKVTRELTDRKQLEAANKELEAFSYSVSHDLRAPLRAMDGFSRILLEEYASGLSEEAQRYLHLISTNALRMGHLVDDLLTFSRLSRQALKKQFVSPDSIVHQCLDELHAEQDGRRVEISIGELPTCQGDPALLKQVWFNLLANAIKYTRKREVAQIEVGARVDPQAPDVSIYFVRDNGVGFEMQYAHKLFGVFQRLHRADEYEGTGVGLAIVQRIVQRHGGRAWVEATVDQGATFFFTLEMGAAHEGQ